VEIAGAPYRALLGSEEWVAAELGGAGDPAGGVRRWGDRTRGGGRLRSLVALLPAPGAGGGPCVMGMTFEDSVRPESAEAVARLRGGAEVLMLTGDGGASAGAAARAVGIPPGNVRAGMTPEGKLRAVERLRAEDPRARVLMVGDGVNDAPALAAADVGVAVAPTADAAVAAAADVVCVGGDAVARLPALLAMARRAQALVRQNVALAALSIALASAPTLLGQLPLWAAVLLHEGATVLVALNSLRALRAPRLPVPGVPGPRPAAGGAAGSDAALPEGAPSPVGSAA